MQVLKHLCLWDEYSFLLELFKSLYLDDTIKYVFVDGDFAPFNYIATREYAI